jgi:hypothetical protein
MILPSTTLGITFACGTGFDAQFSLAQTDAQIVYDEALHRLTTKSVLGDTADAIEFGIDVFERCGAAMTDPEIAAFGPECAAVLQRSPVIETADVEAVRRASTPGTIALDLFVNVTPKNPTTDEPGEPLSFIFRLNAGNFYRVGDPDAPDP